MCQSVPANVFVRAAAGQYDLESPAQLVALLVRMARNRLGGKVRYRHREGRDHERLGAGDRSGPGDLEPQVEGLAVDIDGALHQTIGRRQVPKGDHPTAIACGAP